MPRRIRPSSPPGPRSPAKWPVGGRDPGRRRASRGNDADRRTAHQQSTDPSPIKGKRLLVVDDVADSGRTLALVMDLVRQHGADARSAVLSTKPRTIVVPDYSWRETELWITFPWSAQPPVEGAVGTALVLREFERPAPKTPVGPGHRGAVSTPSPAPPEPPPVRFGAVTAPQAPSKQMAAQLRGEPVLWTGRPDASVLFARSDLFLVPFSVLWGGFAVFWNVGVWHEHAPVVLRLFGVPFLLAGIYLVVGRFFAKRSRNLRLEYALTSSRAVICERRGGARDVPLAHVSIQQNPSRDGRHLSVNFGLSPNGWGGGISGGRRLPANSGLDFVGGGSTAPAFFDVADVSGLESALAKVDRR